MGMVSRIRSCAESILQDVESYDEPVWRHISALAEDIVAAIDEHEDESGDPKERRAV